MFYLVIHIVCRMSGVMYIIDQYSIHVPALYLLHILYICMYTMYRSLGPVYIVADLPWMIID